jgi:transposase
MSNQKVIARRLLMAKPILDDELWKLIEPLIPKKKRRFRYPGRKPVTDRAVLTGILFVLKTGIGWEHLPKEMGCGSGMTCWRRLRDWQKAGVWDKIHHILLNKLRKADKIDFSRAVVDSASVRAILGGKKQVQIPQIDAKMAASTM